MRNINEEVKIREGSTSVRIPEKDSEKIMSSNTKHKFLSSVVIYAKSKAGNKYIPIRNQGILITINLNYDILIEIIITILINLLISGGTNRKQILKVVRKKSKLSAGKDNSTDETDSDFEYHSKEETQSCDVQPKCFKSLTKTIHWNRIKRTSKICQFRRYFNFFNNNNTYTVIK